MSGLYPLSMHVWLDLSVGCCTLLLLVPWRVGIIMAGWGNNKYALLGAFALWHS
jgi:NADH:ubiquinone oxidoreductase subunit H